MITVLLAMRALLLAVTGLAIGIIFDRLPVGGRCGRCMSCSYRKDRQ